eukprot:2149466-Prymnesium_polylepis.1
MTFTAGAQWLCRVRARVPQRCCKRRRPPLQGARLTAGWLWRRGLRACVVALGRGGRAGWRADLKWGGRADARPSSGRWASLS